MAGVQCDWQAAQANLLMSPKMGKVSQRKPGATKKNPRGYSSTASLSSMTQKTLETGLPESHLGELEEFSHQWSDDDVESAAGEFDDGLFSNESDNSGACGTLKKQPVDERDRKSQDELPPSPVARGARAVFRDDATKPAHEDFLMQALREEGMLCDFYFGQDSELTEQDEEEEEEGELFEELFGRFKTECLSAGTVGIRPQRSSGFEDVDVEIQEMETKEVAAPVSSARHTPGLRLCGWDRSTAAASAAAGLGISGAGACEPAPVRRLGGSALCGPPPMPHVPRAPPPRRLEGVTPPPEQPVPLPEQEEECWASSGSTSSGSAGAKACEEKNVKRNIGLWRQARVKVPKGADEEEDEEEEEPEQAAPVRPPPNASVSDCQVLPPRSIMRPPSAISDGALQTSRGAGRRSVLAGPIAASLRRVRSLA